MNFIKKFSLKFKECLGFKPYGQKKGAVCSIKSSLISSSSFHHGRFLKKLCQITIFNFVTSDWKLRIVIWHFFWGKNQSEKLSETKPPLLLYTIAVFFSVLEIIDWAAVTRQWLKISHWALNSVMILAGYTKFHFIKTRGWKNENLETNQKLLWISCWLIPLFIFSVKN